eukprot:gene7183-290_t
MSMGPNKNLDEVSRNKIWEEHVVKENRTITLGSTFHITDPRKLNVLPEKPNNFTPTTKPTQRMVDQATADLASMSCLKHTDKLPAERYALPLTASSEIGFFSAKPLAAPNPQFSYRRGTCDVTKRRRTAKALGPTTTAKKDSQVKEARPRQRSQGKAKKDSQGTGANHHGKEGQPSQRSQAKAKKPRQGKEGQPRHWGQPPRQIRTILLDMAQLVLL